MTKNPRAAEAEARAVNATDWQPLPGMAKRRCRDCRYRFAVPVEAADTTPCCPDCAARGVLVARRGAEPPP